MNARPLEFLKDLLNTPGPSGFEAAPAGVWREEAERFADAVEADVNGNSFATVTGTHEAEREDEGLRVMLAGHIDEIGLMVTHVDENGFLYIAGIGGWDPQVLPGQRVRVLTARGDVAGVVGKTPIHLLKDEEKSKAAKLSDLWVDIGVDDRDGAKETGVRVGDAAVIDASLIELGDDRIVSRAIDNRIGAFVVLEALRRLAEERPAATVTAVATTQEEIGRTGGGARAGAYRVAPQAAIVVDVTFASDSPGIDKKEVGDHELGGGPVLTRGSAVHPGVFERLAEIADRDRIPYSITASPRYTATDADAIHLIREGVATGLVSVPNRYMHSPNEMVSLEDLDRAARLIAGFVRDLGPETEFLATR